MCTVLKRAEKVKEPVTPQWVWLRTKDGSLQSFLMKKVEFSEQKNKCENKDNRVINAFLSEKTALKEKDISIL